MAWVNSYTSPEPAAALSEAELWGPEPYDINFNSPIHPENLESDRVKLTPFIPRIHAKLHWNNHLAHHYQTLYKYYPFVHSSLESFLTFLELGVRRQSHFVLFAIIDETKPDVDHPELGGSLAGIVGLLDTSTVHLSTEIGFIMIYPEFQRTHVATNTVGILLKYCLDPPNASPPGLGMRRVQWQCHWRNTASRALAEKMGLKYEGTFRWFRALPEDLRGDHNLEVTRKGEPKPNNPGRHTDSLAMCWDQWEDERSKVQSIIDRKV